MAWVTTSSGLGAISTTPCSSIHPRRPLSAAAPIFQSAAALQGTASLRFHSSKVKYMLTTIAIIFLVLWALGLVTSYTMGGLIHILLVAAVVIVLVRIIQGRKIL